MKKSFLIMVLFLISQTVFAANKVMTSVPTNWKMENYFGDQVIVFFSGSSCEHGKLSFPSLATISDKNRFWSLILSAKATKSEVFVIYKDDPNCTLVSFASVH